MRSKEILPEEDRKELFWKIENNQTSISLYDIKRLPKALLAAEKEIQEMDTQATITDVVISQLKKEIGKLTMEIKSLKSHE